MNAMELSPKRAWPHVHTSLESIRRSGPGHPRTERLDFAVLVLGSVACKYWAFLRAIPGTKWSKCARTPRILRSAKQAARDSEEVLGALHPSLAASMRDLLQDSDVKVLLIGAKEEIGGVKGVPLSEPGAEPKSLREFPHDCYDVVVEVQSEEVRCASWEAVQNRFYPLGGHSFSLANDFIINLASIAKVLKPGGKFLFLSSAERDEVLPFSFLQLPHLKWQIHQCSGSASGVSTWCCTLGTDDPSAALKLTPSVVAKQCTDETSRRRYFEALRPYLQRDDGKIPEILDYGCGDGSLMSWAFQPEVLAEDGPREVTLVESNQELVERARQKLPHADVRLIKEGEPWPFEHQFDLVVLAFVLHHVPLPDRAALLAEAKRLGRVILVLEDVPDEAFTPAACRLAWHVTEEHFRPFGQDPDDYISGVLSKKRWTTCFGDAGLEVLDETLVASSLRYPVPHVLYILKAKETVDIIICI